MKIKLSKKEEAAVIDGIGRLLSGEFLTSNKMGICYNLNKLAKKCGFRDGECLYSMVSHLGQTWEHFSGEFDYPVPYQVSHLGVQLEKIDLWKGQQLKYRLSLLQHMKDRILAGDLRSNRQKKRDENGV